MYRRCYCVGKKIDIKDSECKSDSEDLDIEYEEILGGIVPISFQLHFLSCTRFGIE
jgi:hypothetical protein